jgi:HAE1 family hydrophobic/amphiphilic exporter-1
MFLSKLSVNKPVLTIIIILFFVVLGIYSYLYLSVALMPEIEFPIITIRTLYPGAGPEEIETLITKPIEEAVSAINGVKTITSNSIEGVSIVVVEFQLEVNIDVAANDVKDKVDAIRSLLPRDIYVPTIMKFDIGAQPIMSLAISGPRPLSEIYEITDEVIKPELSKIEGLASISIVGGKEREILIGVKRDRLKAFNMSLDDIISEIAGANLNLPSGHIIEKWKEFPIRVSGEFITVDEIRNLKIVRSGLEPIALEDVAEVSDTFVEQREMARYNKSTSVGISLIKRADANVVKVAESVEKELVKIKKIIPPEITINIAENESIFIKQSIGEVINDIIIGIFLTAIVLYLFLHNWRSTLIAAIAMPSSIISTLILLRFAGFTINFMTLMGLSISVGTLVTNSIVVLENIFRHKEELGEDAKIASESGTTEIAIAVAASTLTNVVVFTPIAFMSGIIGRFFLQFGLTVTFATLFSLLVSFTLTPMLSSIVLKKSEKEKRGFDIFVLFLISILILLFLCVIFVLIGITFFGGAKFETILIPLIMGGSVTLLIIKKLFSVDLSIIKKNSVFKIFKYIVKIVLILIALGVAVFVFNYLFNLIFSIIIVGIALSLFVLNVYFRIFDKFSNLWEESYKNVVIDYRKYLNWTLDHGILVLIFVLILFFGSIYLFKYVGSEFFTKSDQGILTVDFEMPAGSSLEETDRAITLAENIISELPYVKTVYTEVGISRGNRVMGSNQGVQLGAINVELVNKGERDITVFQFVDFLRPKLSMIPSADIYISERSSMGGGMTGLQIEITGDELNVLNDIASDVMNIAKEVPGVLDVQSSWRLGVPEIQVIPDRRRMDDQGISIFKLASVLRASIQGEVASKFRVKNKEYDIRVRFADADINNAAQVRNIKIKNGEKYVPITDISNIIDARGPVQITRKDKKRLVTISGNNVNRSIGSIVSELRKKTDALQLPTGYSITYGGMTEMQEESFVELYRALILAIVLTYLILAAMLESFIHPFTIMLTLPLGLIGVVLSMIITSKTVSILTLMAIIMLVGIVVNNAILILDYTTILRNRGFELKEAILEASGTRLRPIIMSNLAIMIGMLPLALEIGEGAEMRSPMAIVSIGGLITSTVFTLFVIPVIYYGFEIIRRK